MYYRQSLKTTLMHGVKHDKTSQNAKRLIITLNQKNLNQNLWLSPSPFLFSSSFSSSFLSFPTTNKAINTNGSYYTIDKHIWSSFDNNCKSLFFFRYSLTHSETIVPTCSTCSLNSTMIRKTNKQMNKKQVTIQNNSPGLLERWIMLPAG